MLTGKKIMLKPSGIIRSTRKIYAVKYISNMCKEMGFQGFRLQLCVSMGLKICMRSRKTVNPEATYERIRKCLELIKPEVEKMMPIIY